MTTGGTIGYHRLELWISYPETRHRDAMARRDERREPGRGKEGLARAGRAPLVVLQKLPPAAAGPADPGDTRPGSPVSGAPATLAMLDEVGAQPPRFPTAQRLRRFETHERSTLGYACIDVFT